MPIQSAKHVATPFKLKLPALKAPVALPATQDELQALLQAERARMAAQFEQEITLQLSTEFNQRVQQEVDRRVQEEVARQVATEVARQVQKLLEEARLARHKMFGASSEAHLGQGLLFNEAEALAAPDLGEDADEQEVPASAAARSRSSGRGQRDRKSGE